MHRMMTDLNGEYVIYKQLIRIMLGLGPYNSDASEDSLHLRATDDPIGSIQRPAVLVIFWEFLSSTSSYMLKSAGLGYLLLLVQYTSAKQSKQNSISNLQVVLNSSKYWIEFILKIAFEAADKSPNSNNLSTNCAKSADAEMLSLSGGCCQLICDVFVGSFYTNKDYGILKFALLCLRRYCNGEQLKMAFYYKVLFFLVKDCTKKFAESPKSFNNDMWNILDTMLDLSGEYWLNRELATQGVRVMPMKEDCFCAQRVLTFWRHVNQMDPVAASRRNNLRLISLLRFAENFKSIAFHENFQLYECNDCHCVTIDDVEMQSCLECGSIYSNTNVAYLRSMEFWTNPRDKNMTLELLSSFISSYFSAQNSQWIDGMEYFDKKIQLIVKELHSSEDIRVYLSDESWKIKVYCFLTNEAMRTSYCLL